MLLVVVLLVALLSGLLVLLLWEDQGSSLHRASAGLLTGWWTAAERRSYERTRAALDVRYEVVVPDSQGTGAGRQATSENISEGGICLRLYERLNPPTALKFEILLHHAAEPVRGTGEVRWTREEERRGARRCFLSGVQFVNLSPSERARLSQALKGGFLPTA